MERTLSSALLQTHSVASDKSAWLPRVIATLSLWQRRIVSRRQLARLDARLLAGARQRGALREEAVPGMNGVGTVLASDRDERLDVQVRPDRLSALRGPDEKCFIGLESVE